MSEGLATAVELARASVPRHGSARNLLAEEHELLLTAALPGGITTTWEAHCERRSKRRPRRQRGEPLPPSVPIQEPTRGEEVRPRGPISIEQLFYPAVYKLHVQTWLDAAGDAMEALLSGKRPRRVPTVVITPRR